MKLNCIYNEDCVGFMKRLEPKSIDLIFADPPYNAKDIGPNKRVYSQGPMHLPLKEYKKFCKIWFREAKRVGKTILVTPGISNVCYYPQPNWILCWHKPAAVSFNRMGGFNAWEPIMIYGKPVKGARLGQDYIRQDTYNFGKGPERNHPCPKPLILISKLIQAFSNEGDLVFDPFMGSGMTARAAKNLKRNYIGTEINQEYIDKCINPLLAQVVLAI